MSNTISSALIELHYLPPVAFFTVLARHDTVWIESQEHYQKRSYRNRAHIAGANSILRLSVPLKSGKNEQQPIRAVEISYDEAWQRQHWASIVSAYNNAPFFDFYAPRLEPFFNQKYPLLFDFSWSILMELIDILQLELDIQQTEVFRKETGAEIDDFRNLVHPRKKSPMELPVYPQVFMEKHGFLPNLSILDLLFCTGPQAGLLLEG